MVVQIEGLRLEPLRVASGWHVVKNEFYDLDPDCSLADLEITGLEKPIEEIDVWQDVLSYYFDGTLFWAEFTPIGPSRIVDLDWAPSNDRNGQFVVSLHLNREIKTNGSPKRELRKEFDGIEITYTVKWPVEHDHTVVKYEGRSKSEAAAALNQVLLEDYQL